MAGRGTDVLESDVERTDIHEAHVEEKGALDMDHGVIEVSRTDGPADSLPEPRGEREFPTGGADADGALAPAPAGPTESAPPRSDKARDGQAWASRLTMLAVAVVAAVGLSVLAIAIAREVNSANSSDDLGDLGDLGFSYTCDKVSGSDPGVYGVGHCRAAGGMQASGVIPVGQAYMLTPRTANALGYTQSFSCSGGRAESPSMVVPRRCAAVGTPVLASR